jgi:hypothetical protein
MRKLKPFGVGGTSHNHGYDLPLLVSHLEDLCNTESLDLLTGSGPKHERLRKAQEAVGLLSEAMEPEEYGE